MALVYTFVYADDNNNVPDQFNPDWLENPEALADKGLQILVGTIVLIAD